ncbi:hypothetical protein ACP4OV_009043 [Aristida adscensionis]
MIQRFNNPGSCTASHDGGHSLVASVHPPLGRADEEAGAPPVASPCALLHLPSPTPPPPPR